MVAINAVYRCLTKERFMKEDVLEVLIYLFAQISGEQPELPTDPKILALELEEAGFARQQIDSAFLWLADIFTGGIPNHTEIGHGQKGVRVYTPLECSRMNVTCRGFLHMLVHTGLLKSADHELIIDYIFHLDIEKVDLQLLQWLVLMVIFQRPQVVGEKKWLVHGDITVKPNREIYH